MTNMKEKELPLHERSIADIYKNSSEVITYTIPIYQRNYAWTEDEITALIKDVHDSCKKNKDIPYYIGTLVTYKRGDNVYEVIDGQQRLTTIYIISKALKLEGFKNKLTYSARESSARTIDNLSEYHNIDDEVDEGIINGYKYAKKAIDTIIEQEDKNIFEEYFQNKVHLVHYHVPKDVDLNHYFEVMNSRGEQLEKHEIVKSILCQHLKKKNEMSIFSKVWEACSEMSMYIQQTLPETSIFGRNLHNFIINHFNEIPKQDEINGNQTIMSLLQKTAAQKEESSLTVQIDRFQPIIDFPNFLLIVLKLTRMEHSDFMPTDFILDDKELLNEFKKALEVVKDKSKFVKQFTFNLLKAKFFLDNYIVHHSLNDREMVGDNPWKLQKFYMESSKNKYFKNLAEKDEGVQLELVHLLSMFEVAFTPKQRKNYLLYCLLYLFEEPKHNTKTYLYFLQDLADKYFYDIYLNPENLTERKQPKPNAFDLALVKDGELNTNDIGDNNIDYKKKFLEIYQQGRSEIPLFVFNYTEYILWKKYSDELRGKNTKKTSKERIQFFEELGCSDFELSPFRNFYFSRTRKSLEHFYPQAKARDEHSLSIEEINCFGNFAMIGAEANSSGSNLAPKAKLSRYNDSKSDQVSVASLKLKIMMQMCQDNQSSILSHKLDRENGLEWNYEDIKLHQENMLNIIFRHKI